MGGLLEPCSLHGGSVLPWLLFAPGQGGQAEVYWRGLQDSPVVAGQALDVRGVPWLVESVALWRGVPGGVHAQVRACNASGTLQCRTGAVTAYGVALVDGPGVAVLGVLAVSSSTDNDGLVVTTGDLTPVGQWVGGSGDLVVLDDGSRWEQVGDVLDRTSGGGATLLPTVRLRRVRDGSTGE